MSFTITVNGVPEEVPESAWVGVEGYEILVSVGEVTRVFPTGRAALKAIESNGRTAALKLDQIERDDHV
jgi:hypothetical protein